MTQAGPRLGVFGGAFDPPHLAHGVLAQAAIDQLELDALWVIPTGDAWHKARPLSPATHRLAMARLAFASMPKVVVDDRETRRVGPSYTIDTLLELQGENPLADLFLIIGADQARAFAGWHRWQEVSESATICVAGRDVLTSIYTPTSTPASISTDAEYVPPSALKDRFLRLKMPSTPISATAIRARVAQSEPISALVGEPVARYIAQHHLYSQS